MNYSKGEHFQDLTENQEKSMVSPTLKKNLVIHEALNSEAKSAHEQKLLWSHLTMLKKPTLKLSNYFSNSTASQEKKKKNVCRNAKYPAPCVVKFTMSGSNKKMTRHEKEH
jgi:hypothetical protein